MITIQCNQKCSKCSHWKQKDGAERLLVSKFTKAIKAISTAQELCIVGGEPTLFKSEIYEILQLLSDTSIRATIITNGVLADKDFIDKISNFNIHIVFSIDTLDKEFWRFVRGTNSYDVVFRNFEYATTVLNSAQISIQSVLSKETEPYISEVADYAMRKNLYHSIQDYVSEGFNGCWTEKIDKQIVIPDNEQQCFSANRNLSIMQNGDVFTCFQQSWIDGCQKTLGNLNTQEISEILSSDYALYISKKMKVCNLPCNVLKCNTK
jgi:MoaA/NifB/PqqE/SkfB family radical SAM enzyme